MKTTGSPERRATLVRGGTVQNNVPKAHRRSQAAHRAFEENISETIELTNLLMRIGAAIGAFLFCAAIVILLVVVGTL